MKLVNVTSKTVFTPWTGFIRPGKAVEGNSDSVKFVNVLEELVSACGDKLGIRLSEKEVSLVKAVMDLDEKGCKFDPSYIPEEVRNDPTGERWASEQARAAQQSEMDNDARKAEENARREAVINGEIDDRKPRGVATMEGKPVDPSELKTGFERIMEENARIAKEGGENANKPDLSEILDPIGAHVNGSSLPNDAPADVDPVGKQPNPVEKAYGEDGDATKSADATEPVPTVQEKAGEMDIQAADIARKLSQIGPADEPAPVKQANGARKTRVQRKAR